MDPPGPGTQVPKARSRKGLVAAIVAVVVVLVGGGVVFALTRGGGKPDRTTAAADKSTKDDDSANSSRGTGTTQPAVEPVTTAPAGGYVLAITEPSAGALLPLQPVTVVAKVDPPTAVREAALTVDGTRVASGPNPTLTWDGIGPGGHDLVMLVTLADGTTITGGPIRVTIEEPITAPTVPGAVTTVPGAANTFPVTVSDFLAMRRTPYIQDDNIVGRVPPNGAVEVLCQTTGELVPDSRKGPDRVWYYVNSDGTKGYVNSGFVGTGPSDVFPDC